MTDSRIRILGIAPYEGMKTAMERAAEAYPQIQLDVFIGDLEEGAAIAKNAPADLYDCILSRGGTAELIQKASILPVVSIQLTVYDVLRSIKLAENYSDLYAIVGFPSITEPAHTLCDLLRYDIDILTVHHRDEIPRTLERLKQGGYRMVIGDVATHTVARQMGMDAFLMTSGAESLRAALDQALSFSTVFRQLRQENAILRQVSQEEGGTILLLAPDGTLVYCNLPEPPADMLAAFRSRQKELPANGTFQFHYRCRETLCIVTAQRLRLNGTEFLLFHSRAAQIPLRGRKNGLRSYCKSECEHLFMNSFYSLSGAMGELDTTVSSLAAARQPVLILGEAGTGKEQVAQALYLRGLLNRHPFLVVSCKAVTEKAWDFLLNHYASPLNGTGSTLYFSDFEALAEPLRDQLLAVIRETGMHKRQRLIFSSSCRSGELPPAGVRQFGAQLGCFTLQLPALRDRSDEIPSLASLYLNRLNQELGKQISGFDPQAIQQLQNYDWPGNYTQFQQVLSALAALCHSAYIHTSLVAEQLARERSLRRAEAPAPSTGIPFDGTMEEIIQAAIRQALAAHGGNQTAAARQLGISRTTLWRHLEQMSSAGEKKPPAP